MENKLYCIECGFENKTGDKFCGKCGRSLEQQDDELKNYLIAKVKGKAESEVKDRATNTFLEFLQKFLNSKAYGIILSLSVVAGVGTVAAGGTGYIKEFSGYPSGVFVDGTSFNSPVPTPPIYIEPTMPPDNVRPLFSFGRFGVNGVYENELITGLELIPITMGSGENIPDIVTITDHRGNIILETTIRSTILDENHQEPTQTIAFSAGTIKVESVISGENREYVMEYDENSVLRRNELYIEGRIKEYKTYYENGNPEYYLEVLHFSRPGEVQNFWEYKYDREGRETEGNNCYGDPDARQINYRWRTVYEYRDGLKIAHTYNIDGKLDNYTETDTATNRLKLEIYYNDDGTESSRYEY